MGRPPGVLRHDEPDGGACLRRRMQTTGDVGWEHARIGDGPVHSQPAPGRLPLSRAPGLIEVYPEHMVPRRHKDQHLSREPRHALLAVPVVLIVLVTVIDILAPPSVHLGPFLVAAPAVTASFAGPRATACIGALAVLAQAVVAVVRTSLTDLNHSFQLITLILMSVLVTSFAARRERHERELTQLRSVATAAQEVVLKPLPHRVGPLRIASVYLAAESEAQIGGDLYAAARTEQGTRFVIGDVRGKGLEAVGDAALLLGAFRGQPTGAPT